MFRGEEQQVKLLVNNRMAGVIIDRFGKEVMMIPADADHFRVSVEVHENNWAGRCGRADERRNQAA